MKLPHDLVTGILIGLVVGLYFTAHLAPFTMLILFLAAIAVGKKLVK